MKTIILRSLQVFPLTGSYNWTLLLFRILITGEIIVAHGFRKIGIGVPEAEHVPNPYLLPEWLNSNFAIASDIFFPLFVMAGCFTRLAVLPTLAVTLTGYFVVHAHDSLLEKDVPFMYSGAFLLLFVLGPGRYSVDYHLHKKLLNKH